ncbi:hypothetical protein ACPOL_0455 [Acidisarcina polymorpha]|uniref:PilZ domain-containing protein n=1 Tax=Acidisarcina polymorpha TaxID=2211140 RepID=A0A2Z5FSU1_9BACT|nr:PilZ domain-containing protein [Acidisarcina polymorpha]AXC09832.1 hypothetical protein ACPOL_0455 [Acidisarcina polymorpha]
MVVEEVTCWMLTKMGPEIELVSLPENPGAVEVRCAVRFPLCLPIQVITAKGAYDAITENISASGVLFQSREDLGVDSRVEFLLKMPASVIGAEDDVTLHCVGRVVRSYLEQEHYHAAAVIDDYRFSH